MRWKMPSVPRKWVRWFAWHPVKIAGEWVWLEWVERRPNYGGLGSWDFFMDGWRYRDLDHAEV